MPDLTNLCQKCLDMLRYLIIIEYIVDQLDLWLDYHDVESLDMFEPRN